MKNEADKIPAAISEYITAHFREDFLFSVKNTRELHGHTYYSIEVVKDNFIYLLKFDEGGKLVNEESRLAYPSDMHDESGYEEMSD